MGKVQMGRAKAETWATPSKVFAQRLRETRENRGWSQSELAQLMTDSGRPMNTTALLRVESGERKLTLDEAIALANILRAAPANLLSPPGGELIALTDREAVDGDGMRNWLLTGVGIVVWPEPPRAEDETKLRAWLDRELERGAVALADALRGHDKSGIKASGEAILGAVEKYRKASEEARSDAS